MSCSAGHITILSSYVRERTGKLPYIKLDVFYHKRSCKSTVTIHGPLDRDSNGFCHYKSPAAMGKTHLKP